MALSKRAASEVSKRVHKRCRANAKLNRSKPTIHSKAGLSRWSAVVRGAVDTGCRRNYQVAVRAGK